MNTNQLTFDRSFSPMSALQINVAYAGNQFKDVLSNESLNAYQINHFTTVQEMASFVERQSVLDLPDILLLEVDDSEACFSFIENIKQDPHLSGILIVLLAKYDRADWKARAFDLKVADYYVAPFNLMHLHERIKLLLKLRILQPQHYSHDFLNYEKEFKYNMPVSKRIFDIVCSAAILLFLSPLLLIIAALIWIESKGPVIYTSKRVGTGYKIFDFYKFRSMKVDADKEVASLEKHNQYSDGENVRSVFFKINNDPRVTKVGQFLRNTSLDELPQLFNILIGDMSFVGNRPLPLYEAEQLTSNEWSMRFLGPAGLTGLWQITKRGKKDMSERERKELDNQYARSYSFWLDLKILLKTFPALIQAEKV